MRGTPSTTSVNSLRKPTKTTMTPPITSLSLSPSSTQLALATPDMLLLCKPPEPPSELTQPPTPLPPPTSYPFPNISSLTLPSNDILYTATTHGTLTRYKLSNQVPTEQFSIKAAHSTHPLTSIASLSPTTPIATAAKDGLLKLWDPLTATTFANFSGHRYEIRCVALATSTDTDTHNPVTLIASAGRDKTVRLWDSRTDKPVAVLKGHSGWVHSVALASQPTPIAVSCGGDKTVRVWDLLTMSQSHLFEGHEYRVWDVAVPANAKYCVSASTDATVRAWEIGPRAEGRHTFEAHNDSVLCLAAARDGRFIVSGCEDGTVLVWSSEGLFGHRPGDVDVAEEQHVKEETVVREAQHAPLVELDPHVGKSFDTIPRQMDTTPLFVADAAEETVDQIVHHVVEKPVPKPVESVSSPKSNEPPMQKDDTESLRVAIAVQPQQEPTYDKSAAELVRALQRISDLEKSLRQAKDVTAVKDRELSALKASLLERDATITKLGAELESSKALMHEASVRALLDANPRKADVALDYDEPVNKIGAVSDKLTRLAARLDAMIATN